MNMLKKQAEANKPYGGICASPAYVFEPNGLLKVHKSNQYMNCENVISLFLLYLKLSYKRHVFCIG